MSFLIPLIYDRKFSIKSNFLLFVPMNPQVRQKLKNLILNIFSLSTWKRFARSQLVTPIKNNDGVCLHIGCGLVDIEGWINIDGRTFCHTHFTSHDFDLGAFTNHSVSQIYMSHVLEHFSYDDAIRLLTHFKSKLSPGGVMFIAVPDFAKIANKYIQTGNLSQILPALVGGQNYEYNLHKYVYDFNTLSNLLKSLGFNNVQLWDPYSTFGSSLRDSSLHPLSLNIMASN